MNTIREKFNIIDESFLKTAANVIRFFENEEREEMLQKLRMAVENRYIADIKLQKAEQISETLSAQYGEDESNLQQMLEEYKQQVSQINPDVIGLKHLQEYDKKVEALLQAMAENDQLQNNGDEDIELMQGTVNVIDPITKKRMVDPMKNTCGHSYERESIIALLKSNKKMKCPVPGCRNKNSIEFSQLQPDIVLKTYLMSQKRDELPSYNIGQWVQQLHLQQCAFVEIGENFCALFVELRSIPEPGKHLDNSEVGEFFLGLCTCETLRSWNLCSSNLANVRKSECTFAEAIATANTSARVHRRFCDVTLLANEAQVCNCTVPMAGEQLYRTEGFPTCFRNPLPTSICAPRGVCGVSRCTTITIRGIHSPQCDPDCHQRQPFCEEVGPWTSVPPVINSLWSHWSLPKCNNTCGMGMLMATALCRNLVTGSPATDCIGPGSFCCPNTAAQCICDVRISNGIMKAIRYTGSCTSTDGCDVNDVEDAEQGFQIPRDVIDQDYDKVDYPQNSPGEYLYAFEYEGTQKPVQRRLLGRYRNGYDDENLNLEELNMNFMEDKRHNQESSVNEEMADDSDDEADDEEDEDEDEDEDQRVNSTEGNQDYTDYGQYKTSPRLFF